MGPLDLMVSRKAGSEPPSVGMQRRVERVVGILEHLPARPGSAQVADPVGAGVEVADPVRPAQPLLARGGVEVAAERLDVHGHGAEALGAVEQHQRAARRERRQRR